MIWTEKITLVRFPAFITAVQAFSYAPKPRMPLAGRLALASARIKAILQSRGRNLDKSKFEPIRTPLSKIYKELYLVKRRATVKSESLAIEIGV